MAASYVKIFKNEILLTHSMLQVSFYTPRNQKIRVYRKRSVDWNWLISYHYYFNYLVSSRPLLQITFLLQFIGTLPPLECNIRILENCYLENANNTNDLFKVDIDTRLLVILCYCFFFCRSWMLGYNKTRSNQPELFFKKFL